MSVAIAARNNAVDVGKAIVSALTQLPAPAEVIVCDDGSTDDTAEVLARFGSAITVVRHAHGRGESAAKNTAARAARTDIVVLLDADDVFLPGRLEAIATAFRQHPEADIVTTDAYLTYRDQVIGRWYGSTNPPADGNERLAVLSRNPVFGHAAVRRSAFLDVGGFDESISHAADWDCWIRMVLAGSRIVTVDRPLAHYRMHGGNASANRVAMLSSAIGFLSRAAQRDDVSAQERSTALATVAARGAVLARERLKAALTGPSGSTVRELARAVVTDRRQPSRSRVIALLILVLPGPARAAQRFRDRYWWTGPGGVRLRR